MELENPDLESPIEENGAPLREMVVNYIGQKLQPEDGNITVSMAVEVFATDFPEFLLAVAEENFLRGYEQAIADIEATTTTNEEP